jgi:hypothetical protein
MNTKKRRSKKRSENEANIINRGAEEQLTQFLLHDVGIATCLPFVSSLFNTTIHIINM